MGCFQSKGVEGIPAVSEIELDFHVTTIQSIVRGHRGRTIAKQVKSDKVAKEASTAATAMTKVARGFLGRKTAKSKRIIRSQVRNAAGTKVNTAVRGFLAKAKLNKMKLTKVNHDKAVVREKIQKLDKDTLTAGRSLDSVKKDILCVTKTDVKVN